MHWLAHFFGFANGEGNNPYYLFWSGAGGLVVVWLASAALIWWRTSCKAEWWCMLPGRHDFADPERHVTHKLCWVHHPGVRAKNLGRARIAEIQREHHLYLGSQPGRDREEQR